MTEINPYLARKLSGLCTRCGAAQAADDCLLCPEHREDARARVKARRAVVRAKRKGRGQCVDCGRKAKKRRCEQCTKLIRKRLVVNNAKNVVNNSDEHSGNWRPDHDPITGAEIQRYRGKGRRGRLTYEEQIDEDDRDLAEAQRLIGRGRRARQRLKDQEIRDLPMVQRQEAKRLANEDICRASRILDEQADKYG